jgi:hypothetical protein
LCVSGLWHRITIELEFGDKHTARSKVFSVHVFDPQEDGLEVGAISVFGFEETHPHEVCVVVDDEHSVPKAMRGRDIDMPPKVT